MVDNLEQSELNSLNQLYNFFELHYPYLININENDDLQNYILSSDDAENFIQKFCQYFDIEINDFDFSLYFEDDFSTFFLYTPIKWIILNFFLAEINKHKKIPIKLSNLCEIIKLKKWITPNNDFKYIWEFQDYQKLKK